MCLKRHVNNVYFDLDVNYFNALYICGKISLNRHSRYSFVVIYYFFIPYVNARIINKDKILDSP